MKFKRRGGRKEIILPHGVHTHVGSGDATSTCKPTPLQVALARAYTWQKMIDSGEVKSARAIARKYGIDPMHVMRTLRLCGLAPDIARRILGGTSDDAASPVSVSDMLVEMSMLWEEQREVMEKTL